MTKFGRSNSASGVPGSRQAHLPTGAADISASAAAAEGAFADPLCVLHNHRLLLEQICRGESLDTVVHAVARNAERRWAGMRCAILLLRNQRLVAAAGGSLDPQLLVAAETHFQTAILPTSAATRSIDIQSDRTWKDDRSLLDRLGMRCAWAADIIRGSDRLGVMVGFWSDGRPLESSDAEEFSLLAQTAAVAIHHDTLGTRLTHQAMHDTLTGLPNRYLLDDRLAHAVAYSQRASSQLGLFLIDIDGFATINDTLGHDVGDILLKQIADRLRGIVRQSDTLARIGPDEFAFVASSGDAEHGAGPVAEKLLATLRAPFIIQNRTLFISASIGIGVFPHDGADAPSLQRCADVALCRAKSQGRNCYTFFTPQLSADASERLELEGQLRVAIENQELELFYQPQVDRAGSITGMEALLRWRHPTLGMVAPMRFIGIAEQSGLIDSIGQWVLHEACRQAKEWQTKTGRRLRMAVNVSIRQFAQPNFVAMVEQTLKAAKLAPELLELELTESLLMLNTTDAADKLHLLRNMGVFAAIDDFGTGYSSLAYLHRLPIDTLKIDRSFVMDLTAPVPTAMAAPAPAGASSADADSGTAVIRAIFSMARSLGMNVLAEGIETEAQREFLLSQGCQRMQGYLFGKPMPADKALAHLQAAPASAMAMSA
ncbi:MAG TPA: EAL domain-containing protein [Tepidisphaeraceae bacterium]|nr:EAL domain-containing protein [Tepidisphaeraceae bacterium]